MIKIGVQLLRTKISKFFLIEEGIGTRCKKKKNVRYTRILNSILYKGISCNKTSEFVNDTSTIISSPILTIIRPRNYHVSIKSHRRADIISPIHSNPTNVLLFSFSCISLVPPHIFRICSQFFRALIIPEEGSCVHCLL